MPRSVPPFVSTFVVSVTMPGLSAPPLLFLWLCLSHLLFFLCLLCTWVRFSVCVCICCVSVPVPGLLAFPFAFAVFMAVPRLLPSLSMSTVCACAWVICLYFFIFLL